MVLHVEVHRDSSRCRTCGGRRPCCAASQVPQVRMVQTMQYTLKALQLQSGLSFLGRVHWYTARGSPAIRAGKGWRGRRELAPRCSATQKGA